MIQLTTDGTILIPKIGFDIDRKLKQGVFSYENEEKISKVNEVMISSLQKADSLLKKK